jgi:hypothetical protein
MCCLVGAIAYPRGGDMNMKQWQNGDYQGQTEEIPCETFITAT